MDGNIMDGIDYDNENPTVKSRLARILNYTKDEKNEHSTVKSWLFNSLELFEEPDKKVPNPRADIVRTLFGGGCIAGFLIGGKIGATVAGVEHVEAYSLEIYDSKKRAMEHYHSRTAMRWVRNGFKFGWRAGVFSALYGTLTILFYESNPEHVGTNVVASGVLTGVLYKCFSGWRNMVVAGIVGGAAALPGGALIGTFEKLYPDEVKRRFKKIYHPDRVMEADSTKDTAD